MDEKYPESYSTYLVDSKQTELAVASGMGYMDPVFKAGDPTFDCAVKEFLLDYGTKVLQEVGSVQPMDISSCPLNDSQPLNVQNALLKEHTERISTQQKLLLLDKSKVHHQCTCRPHSVIREICHDARCKPPSGKKKTQTPIDNVPDNAFPTIKFSHHQKTFFIYPFLQRQKIERNLVSDITSSRRRIALADLEKKAKASVTIIGAGIAGLSAADQLFRNGFQNVKVLEASRRIGGRIHSLDFGKSNVKVDMGCPGIDSPYQDNVVFELAQCSGMLDKSFKEQRDSGEIVIQRKGTPTTIDPSFSKKAAMLFRSSRIDLDLLCSTINNPSSQINVKNADFLREERRRFIEEHTSRDSMRDLQSLSTSLKGFNKKSKFYIGDSNGNLGAHLLGLHQKTSNQGEVIRFSRGMASVLQPLTSKFCEKTLKFNTKVERIDWSAFKVKSAREGITSKVKVYCTDGRCFISDHVIITVPLGVLKKHADKMFVPSLSMEKLRTINQLGFGTVSKIQLLYKVPFLDSKLCFTWVGQAKQDVCLTSITDLTIEFNSNPFDLAIIEAMSVGNLFEELSEERLIHELTAILEFFVGVKIPKPETVKRSWWNKNDLFHGTHPYLKMNSTGEEIDILAEPLTFREHPAVMFAGDATFKHFGCPLRAARESGLREAQRLSNWYNSSYGQANDSGSSR